MTDLRPEFDPTLVHIKTQILESNASTNLTIESEKKLYTPLSYYEFIDVIGKLFKEAGISAPLYEEYNESFDEMPIIVYSLVQKRPGVFSSASYKNVQDDKSSYTRILKPIATYKLKDINNPGKIKIIESFPRDYIIRFTPYSTSVKESNELAFQIEDILVKYRKLIRFQGIQDIIYLGSDKKMVIQKNTGTNFIGTPVDVFVRLVQKYELYEYELDNILVSVGIRTNYDINIDINNTEEEKVL